MGIICCSKEAKFNSEKQPLKAFTSDMRAALKDRIRILKEEYPEATMEEIYSIIRIEDLV